MNLSEFHNTGRIWLRDALSPEVLAEFDQATDIGHRPGARLACNGALAPALAQLSELIGAKVSAAAKPLTKKQETPLKPVRCVIFSKTEQANWAVPWHQDRVIAVKDRASIPDYGNWSRKAGLWHCEPPIELLQHMLFVRVHLDDAGPQSGAMQIALGSHRAGAIAAAKCEEVAAEHETETCTAKRGDVLVLNMLLLHRSLPSQTSAPRRVLRVDYAKQQPAAPLCWAD